MEESVLELRVLKFAERVPVLRPSTMSLASLGSPARGSDVMSISDAEMGINVHPTGTDVGVHEGGESLGFP